MNENIVCKPTIKGERNFSKQNITQSLELQKRTEVEKLGVNIMEFPKSYLMIGAEFITY